MKCHALSVIYLYLFYLNDIISHLFNGIYCDALSSADTDRRGPTFSFEPPNTVAFSNSTGTVIPCGARGLPSPSIKWESVDNGQSVSDVAGLRMVRTDGSLVFPPFRPEDYRPDIHSTRYRCIASNSIGTIASRSVHVRGVVRQNFVIDVYDEFPVVGNTAVMRCHIPGFVKDYLTITAWIEEPTGRVIQPTGTIIGNHSSRYLMLQSGELYIRNVDSTFNHRTYKCRARNRLTGDTFTSGSAGKLIVTESHSVVSPRITESKYQVNSVNGESVVLPCVAQGWPLPTYKWFRKDGVERIPLSMNDRITILDGILLIRDVDLHDTGLYQCIVNNTIGEEKVETELIVRSPLSAQILPIRQSVDVGKSALFNCSVSGHPITTITWERNHKRLKPGFNTDIRFIAKDLIHIDSVHKEHRGMYQCFVSNDFESVQANAELLLGDDPPEFRETFKSQTLEPGPSLSLKCIAGGSPLPQITWQLDDAPIPESLRVRFGDYVTKDGLVISYVNISETRVEDGGGYECRADNGVASIEHYARINVIGPPVVRPMRNLTVVASEPLIVRCPVGGYPLESITWERAGHRLPYNHRQKVHDNGTLEVYHIERATDEGMYTCIARNKKGQTAQSSVFVQVTIKPVIEPFAFPKSLREGQRASVLCTVSSGDMPITLRWFKDNVPISEHKGVRVNEVADYSSTLLFESLTLDHKGNYTCIAANNAGTVSHTASMIIHVPPRWTVEPSDTSVVRGRSVTIDCATQGYPYPRIIWTKSASSNAPRDFKPIVSGPHLQVYENGSLSIQDARDTDQGYYLCQASNGIGQGLSKVVKISVHVAAHFKSKFTAEMVRKGHNIRLKCEALGDKPIGITWTRDKQKIDAVTNVDTMGSSSPDNRYELNESITTKGIVSEVLIKKADRRDSSQFTCLASNAFGYDDTNIQLIVQEPPDPPQDVHLLEITSRSVKISWSPPYSGNSPIINYYIQYRTGIISSDLSKWSMALNVSIPSGETVGQIVGLRPSVLYFFRLISENHIGRSEASRTIETMTEEESPGGPPNNIKVNALSSRSISVTWDPPNIEQQHGVIRGYYIGYKIFGSASQFVYKTLEIREGTREEVILTGLKQATYYQIVVQAFNNKGAGPSSEEMKIQTLEMDAPMSPQIQVTSSSGSSIHLAWDPVADDENPIDGYVVFQRQESSTEWKETRILGQQSFYTALDLKCGTRYQFYLIAFNKIGRGEGSDIVTVKTDGSVPVAPDKASVVTVNTSSAVIHLDSWHHGGCPITKFKLRYRLLSGSGDWIEIHQNSNEKQIELNNLRTNTKYQLQITSYNEVGFTEAEYTFSTLSDNHELNPRTASGHTIRGANKNSSTNINEYSLVIPVAITLLVIIILLVIVALVLRKSSTNGSIYSRKQDTLQMSHLGSCKSGRSTYTNSPYNTPHTCNNGTETTPKVNGDFANRLMDEPLYATVKRTPRAPRSEAHIYSYPIQAPISELTNMQMNNTCANPSTSLPQTATLIVTVDERDLEEKLLDELQHQCPLNDHRLSITHCR